MEPDLPREERPASRLPHAIFSFGPIVKRQVKGSNVFECNFRGKAHLKSIVHSRLERGTF